MIQTTPKLIGFEIECGAVFQNRTGPASVTDAAHALAASHHILAQAQSGSDQETVNEFDADAFRCYLDHDHFEISSPLTKSAGDLVMLVREARRKILVAKADVERREGPLHVFLNNTNRLHACWGGHLNVLVTRKAFDGWRDRRWSALMAQWVPFLVTSLPLFGAGKTGAENKSQPAAFQLSQRADYIDKVEGLQTVESKSLINTRDEPLADPDRFARFHITYFDTNQAEFTNWLKFGCVQLLLALLEEGVPLPTLHLEEPLESMAKVSRDLAMHAPLPLTSGRKETALSVQYRLAESATDALERGCKACAVPDSRLLVEFWIKTLDGLAKRESALVGRLDWLARLRLIRQAMERPGKSERNAVSADLLYGEVGGVFDGLEESQAIGKLEDFLPRKDWRPSQLIARDRARSEILKRFGDCVIEVDWDRLHLATPCGTQWEVSMEDPLDCGTLLSIVSKSSGLPGCLEMLRAEGFARTVQDSVRPLEVATDGLA